MNTPISAVEREEAENSVSVWLVEDDHVLRKALVRVIGADPGLRCTLQVDTAEEAIRAVQEQPSPDVLLLDINLPGMNGIEALSVIKPLRPDVRVVVMTSDHDEDLIFKAILAGASGYVYKTSFKDIIGRIHEVVRGGVPLSPAVARAMLDYIAGTAPCTGEKFELTQREMEVLRLITAGMLKKEVSEALAVSYHTVDSHLRSIYAKLGVNSRSQAVCKALREGLVQ
jgi:DNA-binding NarL/FixJ family response regulator